MFSLKLEHGGLRNARARSHHRSHLRGRAPHTIVIVREHPLLEGNGGFTETLESIRLKLLRDQIDEVIGMMKEHGQAIEIVAGLLKDEGVGVAVIAADVLKRAVSKGLDITKAEDGLQGALGNKYAKGFAAAALALSYIRNGNVRAVEQLLSNPDPGIHDAVSKECVDIAKPPSGR